MRPILRFSSLIDDGDNKKFDGIRPVNDTERKVFYQPAARIFRKRGATIRVGHGFFDCVHNRIPEPATKIALDA